MQRLRPRPASPASGAWSVPPRRRGRWWKARLLGLMAALAGRETWSSGAETSEEALLRELEKLAAPAIWSTSGSLRAGGGYRDNIQLSSLRPLAAGFVTFGGDVTLHRVPTDGTGLTLFASGDYTAFVDEPHADPEALALLQADLQRELGRPWTAGLQTRYVFLDQVFDVSATEADLATVTARGHLVSAAPSLARELGAGWTATASVEGAGQWFAAPLDDYYELTPALTLTRVLGRGGEWSGSYRHDRRGYAERPPLAGDGSTLPGRLAFASHEVDLRARVYWDAARHWSSRFRLGLLVNEDNGGGYFDHTRYAASVQVRWRAAGWSVLAELRGLRYQYATRRVGGPETARRRKEDWGLRLRLERELSRHWMLFAQWDGAGSDDRLPAADYTARTVWIGLEWTP